jgi:hypothetical protein
MKVKNEEKNDSPACHQSRIIRKTCQKLSFSSHLKPKPKKGILTRGNSKITRRDPSLKRILVPQMLQGTSIFGSSMSLELKDYPMQTTHFID